MSEVELANLNARLAAMRVKARRLAAELRDFSEQAEMPDGPPDPYTRPLDNDPVTVGERNRVMAVDLARRAVDTVKAADLLTYSDDELLAEIGRRGAAHRANLLGTCPCPICERRRVQLGIAALNVSQQLDPDDA